MSIFSTLASFALILGLNNGDEFTTVEVHPYKFESYVGCVASRYPAYFEFSKIFLERGMTIDTHPEMQNIIIICEPRWLGVMSPEVAKTILDRDYNNFSE